MGTREITKLPVKATSELTDLHEIVDSSDTSSSIYGTNKKVSNELLVDLVNKHAQLDSNRVAWLGTLAEQDSGNISLTGGGINAVEIGGTIPASAKFTPLNTNAITAVGAESNLTLAGHGNGSVKIMNGLSISPEIGGTNKLKYYEENYLHSTNWANAFSPTQGPIVLKITRINNWVYILFPEFSATANVIVGDITMASSLPSRFRPIINQYCLMWLINDGNIRIGGAFVQTNGSIFLKSGINLTSAFFNNTICGFKGNLIRYTIT